MPGEAGRIVKKKKEEEEEEIVMGRGLPIRYLSHFSP
jgi:hypothetical protein